MKVQGVWKLLQVVVLGGATIGIPGAALAVLESEPNQSIGSATPFNAGDTLQGDWGDNLGAAPFGRDDYWGPVSLNSGEGLNINAGFTNCSGLTDPVDVGVLILNGAGATIMVVDNAGTCQAEVFNFTASSAGNYYVVLFDAFDASNGITQYNTTTSMTGGVTPTPTATPPPTPTPTPTATPIPTVSEWGLIVMGLLMLTMGGVVILRRQSRSA